MIDEKYTVKVICSNCDKVHTMSIPKGKMIGGQLCHNCGNRTLILYK